MSGQFGDVQAAEGIDKRSGFVPLEQAVPAPPVRPELDFNGDLYKPYPVLWKDVFAYQCFLE